MDAIDYFVIVDCIRGLEEKDWHVVVKHTYISQFYPIEDPSPILESKTYHDQWRITGHIFGGGKGRGLVLEPLGENRPLEIGEVFRVQLPDKYRTKTTDERRE